jgi:hypothetical protein
VPIAFGDSPIHLADAALGAKADFGSVDFELFALGLPRTGAKSFRPVPDVLDLVERFSLGDCPARGARVVFARKSPAAGRVTAGLRVRARGLTGAR